MMKNFLIEFLFPAILLIVVSIIVLFISIIGIGAICEIVDYSLSKSYCTAYVDNNKVYEGRCHFLSVRSVGENGNSKIFKIYEDVIKLRVKKEYLSENIKVVNK